MDHYQEVFSDTPPPFAKYQRNVAIAVFIGFQCVLYLFGILSIYALVTFNIPLMIILGAISLLQSFATRNQRFIDYINNHLQVRRYSKGFQLIYQQPIEQDNKCLFGMHPHGVLSTAILASMNLKKGPLSKVVGLSSRFMLSCPVVGLFLRLWGVESVDNNHMKSLMQKGKNMALMPGGFEEATLTTPKQLRLFIKKRKGFIKYAMEHNYSLYPILYLNEHRAFWTFDYFTNFRLFLNRLKLPAVIFWNMKSLLFLPPDMEYISIVGKKINYRLLKQGQLPTKAQIDQTHYKYIEEIKRIYQKYQHLNGDVPLKIY